MQAVLLVAGANKRFFPLETLGHKAMTRLYGRPLIEYVIEDLRECGIHQFVIVVPKGDKVITTHLQKGEDLGVTIQYAYQDSPKGQGNALLCAADLINESFIIPNAYHILEKNLFKTLIDRFNTEDLDGLIPAKYEEGIHEYGALDLDGERIKSIIEKPRAGTEPSHYRSTSAFLFKPDFIHSLKNRTSHQYAYEEAISDYAHDKKVLMHKIEKEQYIPTLKYPWHLLELFTHLALTKIGYISPNASIAKTAIIEDTAYIDDGAIILDGAHIKGHTYIGRNVYIGDHSVIRDSDIGKNAQIGIHADIARSIIMEDVHFHADGFIGDSVIGSFSRLGAGFITANKRMDRKPILSYMDKSEINTTEHALGVICGKQTSFGVRVSTMPGILVGEKSTIWPAMTVYTSLPHSGKLKPKIQP